MPKPPVVVALALCALSCAAQGPGPAPATVPPSAPVPASAAAATTAEPRPGAAAAGMPREAAAGTVASPADEWKPAPAGEIIGTVPMRLVAGLDAVDLQPRTLQGGLLDEAPQGVDASALPPGGWTYGSMPVTNSETVAFAAAHDREWLVFDADRDGILAPHERVPRAATFGNIAWFDVVAPVRQVSGGKVLEMDLPARIGVMLSGKGMVCRLNAHREGVATVGSKQVRLAIVDLTFRGWFSHPGIDQLIVDADGDGRFDTSPDSFERYRLGEPFPCGEADCVVTSVGPFGSTLTLARSTKPAERKASLRIGSKAPAFAVKSIDDKPVDLAKLQGKWVMLDFWATWCGPCRNEIPHLKALRQAHPDVVLIGLSGDDSADPVKAFVKTNAMDWTHVHAQARDVMRKYRVTSFPTSFVIAPDGTIATRDLRGPGLVAEFTRLKAAFKK